MDPPFIRYCRVVWGGGRSVVESECCYTLCTCVTQARETGRLALRGPGLHYVFNEAVDGVLV